MQEMAWTLPAHVRPVHVTTYKTTPAWDPRDIGCTRPKGWEHVPPHGHVRGQLHVPATLSLPILVELMILRRQGESISWFEFAK